jgi:geranylgeranyl diphosphate synthase type I
MPVAAPASLAAIAERVEARLERLTSAESERWAMLDPDLRIPTDEIAALVLGGGKRLRPAFCHWGFVAAGGSSDDPRVIDAGAALEVLHAFALFHDDVMDDSATRRGQETVHRRFARDLADRGGVGEPRRFGEGVALLIGDVAHVYADSLLLGAEPAVWALWNEMRLEINVGQLLDVLGSARRERRLEVAERICRYKSGKYTVERPLQLGALLAAPKQADTWLAPLSAYGLPLGDAFQMRDDVMGAFGSTAETGKPVGDDLREGKPTPLLATAYAAATRAQREVLDLVGGPLDPDAVARVQQAIVDTGALATMESRIAALRDEAVGALEAIPAERAVRDELAALAVYVTDRVT